MPSHAEYVTARQFRYAVLSIVSFVGQGFITTNPRKILVNALTVEVGISTG